MIILDLDAGNSRLKWRLSKEKEILCSGILNNDRLAEQVVELLANIPEKINFCRLSSVRSNKTTLEIINIVEKTHNISVKNVEVIESLANLQFNKIDSKKFGVDRWLSLLAAKQIISDQAIMVIDCGTAITIDKLSAKGEYEGGWIVPGVHALIDSMVNKTDLLSPPPQILYDRKEGFTTIDAMQFGISNMIAAMIEQSFYHWRNKGNVFICGGDGEEISKIIKIPFIYCDNLVLDGLTVALPL